MGKVRVKGVYDKDPNDPGVGPILVKFQHAQGSRSSSNVDLNRIFNSTVFHTDAAGTTKDYSHLNRNKTLTDKGRNELLKRKRELVALQTSSMTYLGTSEEDDLLKTYVALRQGKKMKVYQVTPITVSPFIKGHSHVVEKERDTGAKKSKEDKKAAAIDLVKSFGSKKKRLTYEKMEKHKIDAQDMNESMAKAATQLKAEEEEPKVKDESVLTLIPPCNREVRNPEEVYSLSDIITPEEMSMMDDLAYEFLNITIDSIKEWRAAKKFSDYFFAMWYKLSPGASDSRNIKTAKLVLFTELLICVLKLRHEQIRRKNVEFPQVFPQWLIDKALDMFTEVNAKGLRTRSEAQKDKTICYVMVLVLFANDFVLDMQLMSTSVNVHIKKLLTLAKAVGVTLTYNNVTKDHRGILKCPLPKPIENRGRRRAFR